MSGDAADGYQSLWLKAAPGDGLLDFVTAARAADGKLMTKVFCVDGEGREQARSYDKAIS